MQHDKEREEEKSYAKKNKQQNNIDRYRIKGYVVRRKYQVEQKKSQEVMPVNTKAKDTFFKKVYETEERRRKLAAFLLGVKGEKMPIANVRPVLFGNRENDLAFLCAGVLYLLMEQQSTVSPNVAYRVLEYVIAGLRSLVDSERLLYGKKRVYFPVPKLYVLQVGLEPVEEKLPEQVQYDIRLSDSYIHLEGEYEGKAPDLEAVVHVYDFRMTLDETRMYIEWDILPERFKAYDNDMRNYALVANGITYMQKISKDKKYSAPSNVATVAEYLELMLERNIFVDLLSDKEVVDMTMAQFSRDDILIYQGETKGWAKAVIKLLEKTGELSEALRNRIMDQEDLEVLEGWLIAASRAEKIEDFEQAIGLIQM